MPAEAGERQARARRARRVWLALVGAAPAALAACQSPRSPEATPAPPPAVAAATSVAAAPPAMASSVTIADIEPGAFEIRAASPTRLRTEATLERKTAGGWEPLRSLDVGRGYRLVRACSEDAPCVDVAPGRPLVPVPWSGFDCSAQCNGSCRANAFEGPGTFHLVVQACDGAGSVTSPEFELPDVLRAHDLERWSLVSDASAVTVARLDFPKTAYDAASPAAPGRIAGFVVRAGTEHRLDPKDAEELAALVRDNKGFDDRSLDRCRSRNLVGFRVERSPRTTGASAGVEVAEIALDFACDKLFAAHGGTALPRRALAARFAPSRARFLALVKRALPGDAEIARLR